MQVNKNRLEDAHQQFFHFKVLKKSFKGHYQVSIGKGPEELSHVTHTV